MAAPPADTINPTCNSPSNPPGQGFPSQGSNAPIPPSLTPLTTPQIIPLNMLDTDYAQMVAGEVISTRRCDRLGWGQGSCDRLGQQIARYRYNRGNPPTQDDALSTIAGLADLFTSADWEAIHDRLRKENHFYLTAGERRQVLNWIRDEVGVDLTAAPRETP